MSEFEITVIVDEIEMSTLGDILADGLENLGYDQDDYSILVKGPPELYIGYRDRH